MLQADPNLPIERKDMLLPRCTELYADSLSPNLANDRIDILLDMLLSPMTESCRQEPTAAKPMTEREDPARANDLTEKDEPQWAKFSKLVLPPTFMNDRIDIELPKAPFPRTLKRSLILQN